jgi:glycosyltransferase involved in cell wall biosynthesis
LTYKGFQLQRVHGRVYATRPPHNLKAIYRADQLDSHPAVLSTMTVEEMYARIDGLKEDRTSQPVEPGNEQRDSAVPVEFAGWLPVYEVSGNCGQHPQFRHIADPPEGYRFTCSAPPAIPLSGESSFWERTGERLTALWGRVSSFTRPFFAFFKAPLHIGLWARLRILVAIVRLLLYLRRRGGSWGAIVRFLQSRHLQSQLLLGNWRDLVFLTSMPYTYGQNPWVLEIEDPTTLFFPLLQNGRTSDLMLRQSPYFPIMKAMLEADHCKAILTHMKSTAELVPALFESEIIRNKIIQAPLGVRLPARWQRHDDPEDEPIHLLFTCSWLQGNFFVRGGLDVLEAFAILRERYPQLRLTLRTMLPGMAAHYHRIIESGWVRVINRFLSADEMAELHASSHIYLLPACRVHIVSLLQAMSHGLAVVASDGWGFEEYIRDGHNGLIVRGRYGKTSWIDPEARQLREDYDVTMCPDPVIIDGLVEAVSRLVEDRKLRARLGRTARADVETKYNLTQWNRTLQATFDRARGVDARRTRSTDLGGINTEERQTAQV